MGNKVTLEFAGDAEKLAKASKKAQGALDDVEGATKGLTEENSKAEQSSGKLLDKFSKLGNAVSGAGDAIDQASGLLDTFSQIQSQSYEQNQKQQRALNDVKQAQEDYNQAIRDSKQATLDAGQSQIDKKQADLDAAKALAQYNADVKQYGKNSLQAKQDQIDLTQAQQDGKQATEDGQQALRDANQATIDAKSAQLDLNDAQREAHPPEVEKWSQQLQTYAPLLSGLVGVTGLVTGAQWLWNAAQAASPTTWIILAIAALIAIIVVIATKTRWFQDIWKVAWKGIKTAAESTWDFLKKIPGWLGTAFSKVGNAIFAPFRWAFNKVSDAWNNTIGRLAWSVPGWVPGIGGDSISVPQLPHFHSGGTVPGTPGSEMLAVLQAGETVTPAGRGGGGTTIEIRSGGSQLDDLLVEILSNAIRRRGGNAQLVLGGRNA
jgi:hypothetical protein